MEKLLRYLNPKTVNFDAMPSSGLPAFTTSDACLVLSYAKLTLVQTVLFQSFAMNQNSSDQLRQSAKIILQEFSRTQSFAVVDDAELSIYIALVELCTVPANYKPSERNRAVIGGVSRMQIQRKLGVLITQFKSDLKNELEKIQSKLEYQIKKDTL